MGLCGSSDADRMTANELPPAEYEYKAPDRRASSAESRPLSYDARKKARAEFERQRSSSREVSPAGAQSRSMSSSARHGSVVRVVGGGGHPHVGPYAPQPMPAYAAPGYPHPQHVVYGAPPAAVQPYAAPAPVFVCGVCASGAFCAAHPRPR